MKNYKHSRDLQIILLILFKKFPNLLITSTFLYYFTKTIPFVCEEVSVKIV